jgi:hypothetical protein
VPFVELPAEQQVKDALFRSIVHAVAARLPVADVRTEAS